MAKKRSRQSHTGSVYQSGGYWWAAIMINGTRRKRRCTSQAKANAKLASLIQDVEKSAGLDTATFGGFRDRWLAQILESRSPNTHDAYTSAMEKFDKIKSRPLHQVTGLMVQQVIEGLPGRTKQQAFDKCRQMLEVAVKWNCLSHNPMDGMTRPKYEQKTVEPFTIEEMQSILTLLKGHRYEAAVQIALSCGPRGGELWGLQWSDLEGPYLTIARQVSERGNGQMDIRKPKTKSSSRRIMLPDSSLDLLADRRKQAMKEGNAKSPWIFCAVRDGGPTRRTSFGRYVWAPALESLGIRARGFHHTRHTAATVLLNSAGVPLSVVSKMLGHADPSVTLKIYAHVMTSDLSKYRNAFDAVVKRA